MIHLKDASQAGISLEAIYRQIEADKLHFTAEAGGRAFICLNALME